MKKYNLVYLLLFFTLSITSCQKDADDLLGGNSNNQGGGSNNNTGIVGDYNFINVTAHTVAEVSVTDGGVNLKSITTSDYITKNNVGTMKITATDLVGTGIGYSVDTVMNVKTYLDGVLFDDSQFPFTGTYPPSNSTSPYVKNTNDSITVTGAMGVPSGGTTGGTIPTGPIGFKYKWSADTLILTTNTITNQSIVQGGVPATVKSSANVTMKLKKK